MTFLIIFITIYLSIGIATACYGLSLVEEDDINLLTLPGMIVFTGLTLLWPLFLGWTTYSYFRQRRTFITTNLGQ